MLSQLAWEVCYRASPLEMMDCLLRCFVFKVPLALLRLCVFVLAQNIFIELHVGSKKVLEPRLDSLSILQHFLADVIGIDINTNRADDSEFFSFDRDRGAFEFSSADVQLVVRLSSFKSWRRFRSISRFVVPSRKCRPVTLFSSVISECAGSARL